LNTAHITKIVEAR